MAESQMSPESLARRRLLAPGPPAGVDEALIARVVHAFYGRVRADPTLGPIFDAEIGDGWDAHLAKLCDFWSSVLLMTGRFKGAPMAVHAALPQIGGGPSRAGWSCSARRRGSSARRRRPPSSRPRPR